MNEVHYGPYKSGELVISIIFYTLVSTLCLYTASLEPGSVVGEKGKKNIFTRLVVSTNTYMLQ